MTRRKRTGMILVLGVAVLLVVAGGAFAAFGFTDVAATNVHGAAIQWASDHGIVLGYSDGTFKPTNSIQRDQATSMFMRYDTYLRGSLPATGGVAGCTDCHNDSTLITGKKTAWMESLHGTGTAYARGTSADCAGCHSGGAFSAMVAAGQDPSEVTTGDMDPTRQDCRACHQIHTTNTGADFTLETTDPVDLYTFEGVTFNGGRGNLCANCHQPRRTIDQESPVVDGMRLITSSHWGPHHGPQSATMLGVGGAGPAGTPMFHYTGIEDTCVTCHMSGPQDHKFEPAVSTCSAVCHTGAKNFNIGNEQAEVKASLVTLENQLEVLGYLDDTGNPTGADDIGWDAEIVDAVISTDTVEVPKPAAKVEALWNWIYIGQEDKSFGVHNPGYINGLLDAAIIATAPAA